MSGAVALPARMDSASADALQNALRGDGPLIMDASGVVMMGGLALEVILRAAARRHDAGNGVTVDNASDGFKKSLAAFGLEPERLVSGGFPQ